MPSTKKQKIMIAGGAGYLGSMIGPRLIKDGHEVVAVDLLWFGNNLDKNIKLIKKNIFSLDESFVSKFDQIIFVAGLSNDPMANYSPKMNYIYNTALPAYLAYIAKKGGVKRFIYSGTCSVYGDTNVKVATENTPPRCFFPYGVSKLSGEVAALQLINEKFSVISLRKVTVGGYSPRTRFDLLVNALYMSAITKGRLVISNSDIWRPILAMSDCIEAYAAAVAAEHNINGIFNIISQNLTLLDTAKIVQKYFKDYHGTNVDIKINKVYDPRNYRVSNKKARDILSFEPKSTIEHILKELDDNLPPGLNFDDPRYYNIKVFEKIMHKDEVYRIK